MIEISLCRTYYTGWHRLVRACIWNKAERQADTHTHERTHTVTQPHGRRDVALYAADGAVVQLRHNDSVYNVLPLIQARARGPTARRKIEIARFSEMQDLGQNRSNFCCWHGRRAAAAATAALWPNRRLRVYGVNRNGKWEC